jgi:hypothetical protein
MDELIWLSTGVALALGTDWLFRFWRRSQASQRRSEAVAVLKKHGLSPRLYLATIGVDDDELRNALDEFAYSGHIIINSKDEVVGKICPRVVKGPQLRLVVSND